MNSYYLIKKSEKRHGPGPGLGRSVETLKAISGSEELRREVSMGLNSHKTTILSILEFGPEFIAKEIAPVLLDGKLSFKTEETYSEDNLKLGPDLYLAVFKDEDMKDYCIIGGDIFEFKRILSVHLQLGNEIVSSYKLNLEEKKYFPMTTEIEGFELVVK